jgi:hypothetical protein
MKKEVLSSRRRRTAPEVAAARRGCGSGAVATYDIGTAGYPGRGKKTGQPTCICAYSQIKVRTCKKNHTHTHTVNSAFLAAFRQGDFKNTEKELSAFPEFPVSKKNHRGKIFSRGDCFFPGGPPPPPFFSPDFFRCVV